MNFYIYYNLNLARMSKYSVQIYKFTIVLWIKATVVEPIKDHMQVTISDHWQLHKWCIFFINYHAHSTWIHVKCFKLEWKHSCNMVYGFLCLWDTLKQNLLQKQSTTVTLLVRTSTLVCLTACHLVIWRVFFFFLFHH